MITVTPAELEQYRTEFADDEVALRAIDMIEDCEGDLEDAAISLALRVGQEPDRSEQWLAGLAKRWRVSICQGDIKQSLTSGSLVEAVKQLGTDTSIPGVLALPVILYVTQIGLEQFCQPLQEKL